MLYFRKMRDAGIAPRTAQRGIWLVQTVLGLVAAGVGVAVVPSSADALHRQGVTLRPLRDSRQRVELAAVWLPDHRPPPLDRLLAMWRARPVSGCRVQAA